VAEAPTMRAARMNVRLSLRVTNGLYTRPFRSVKTSSVGIPRPLNGTP
jgi:hypothetical protein